MTEVVATVREEVKAILSLNVIYKLSDEVAKEHNVTDKDGNHTTKGGYGLYKIKTVEDLNKYLGYTDQELVTNTLEANKVPYPRGIEDVSQLQVDTGEVTVSSLQFNVSIGDFSKVGDVATVQSHFRKESKFTSLQNRVQRITGFRDFTRESGEIVNRPVHDTITKNAPVHMMVYTDESSELVTEKHLDYLKNKISNGETVRKLVVAITSPELSTRFVMKLEGETVTGYTQKLDEDLEGVPELDTRNLAELYETQVDNVLIDNRNGLRLVTGTHGDTGEKTVTIQTYKTDDDGWEALHEWNVNQDDFIESEMWKLYDEAARKIKWVVVETTRGRHKE